MGTPAKKFDSESSPPSIGLERPSYFRRLSALFGGGAEVETVESPSADPPADLTGGAPNGRVVSLRGSHTPPPAVEPWMKRKPGESEAVSIDLPGSSSSARVQESAPVPVTPATIGPAPLPAPAAPGSSISAVTTVVEPELFTEQEIGAIRAPEPEKAEPQLPNPIVSTVLSPSAPRPENEVPGTEDYTMRRRTIESTLLRVLPESIHFENEVICQLCESLRAEHACLWLVPPDLGTIWDWGRKTIIAEAAAQSHNQNPFTHTPPPREWAIQYLDPILRATGATVFNVPPPFQPGGNPNARSNYLAIALTGHPGYRWAMMFERSGPPWRESDAMLLEDLATTLSLALEGRLLAKQSIERGTYLNNLLNSSDIAVMVIEQTTPGKPVITLVNQRFRELFGISKAKLAGGSPREMMDLIRASLRDWDAQMKILEGLLAEPASERIDEMILSEATAGVRILHRYTAPARDSTGHIFGRMFFFRDITYDKEMERQIIHSQKMDSIGTLAGGVAHDFNNLLTTILGYTELLKRATSPDDPSSQKLLQIERSANRAAELTGQLLAFSRRNPTNLRLFDLNKLIEETHGMLRSTVPATIEMRFTPQGGLPYVEADETQIQQVIINLVLNARDALSSKKGGGQITITTRRGVDAQATAENAVRPFAVLEVEDNGIGIPKESLHRIFEPFFTTKDVGKGTGLGLAMVYGIIKKHNGFIEVNSAEKIGTKFSVFIPAREVEHTEEVVVAPRAPSARRPVKIMVVDDEPDLREFCAAALGDIATEVLTASNGLEALEVFQRADFDIDLVVLDLTMPKMAGPECAYLMRTMKPTLKILISSGYGPDVTADPQLEGQVAGFLPKPYDLNQLIRKVEEVLDMPETGARP